MTERRFLLLAFAAIVAGAAPAEAKTRSRSVSVTGSGGRTASGTTTRSYDRTTGAYARQSTQTGPNGRTRSVPGQGTTQDGTYTGSRTVTGPSGDTRTAQMEATRR
jgi:hypothetical protein